MIWNVSENYQTNIRRFAINKSNLSTIVNKKCISFLSQIKIIIQSKSRKKVALLFYEFVLNSLPYKICVLIW